MASDVASGVWPVGGGHAGALIQARGWSRTPLGEIGQWPDRLRAAVDDCLDAAFASLLRWGHELIKFYNDPALAIMRARHPEGFGVPAREAWADVWTAIGPALERVIGTGRPVVGERVPLTSGQGEPDELTRLRFSHSALRDGAGAVGGIQVSVFEATERARAAPAVCCRRPLGSIDLGCLLATNARKNGALATEQGRLRIAWKLEPQRNASSLVFNWVEENGCRAVPPPGSHGYGRELIEQALPYSSGAETRYELDETGLRCSIALPLGTEARQERRS
jgi:hypothetical protein